MIGNNVQITLKKDLRKDRLQGPGNLSLFNDYDRLSSLL